MFSVHDEGTGLWSLVLTPAPLPVVWGVSTHEPLWEVSPGSGPATPLRELSALQAPLDLLASSVRPERGALADPASIRCVGLRVHDPLVGIVWAREPRDLAPWLRAWLQWRLHQAELDAPRLDDSHVARLLAPLPLQAWHELEATRHQRIWTAELATLAIDDDGVPVVLDAERWVGSPTAAWRSGWSW